MYFMIFASDRPGAGQLRVETRETHRAYLRDHPDHPGVSVVNGGPTLGEDGKTMNGSLLIVDAPSLDAVKAFAADDPYAKAGLFAESHIRPWNWTLGRPD